MSSKTQEQYSRAIAKCKDIFEKKNADYGMSWRVLRLSSLIDQLYIKAKRIRTIEENKAQKIEDDIESEFLGLVNYCAMAQIQIRKGPKSLSSEGDEPFAEILGLYLQEIEAAKILMLKKNHDYGEVWRDMWISSYTDLILSKLLRIRQIIENEGKTQVSEGISSNLYDIINYSVFALIKFEEKHEQHH
ncbi:MAG: DUF1599 domain-containing protein [Bacteroidetes bacterium]|nr:DUF1599 domain-containing protein [Bacteroidota bacterium]